MAESEQTSESIADGSYSAIKLDVFPLFPDLPPELRGMIIKEACFVPRNVGVWRRDERKDPYLPAVRLYSFRTKSPLPSILQVNQEFRKEALRWYDLALGTRFNAGHLSRVLPPQIYINWDADALCIMGPWKAYSEDINHESSKAVLDACRTNSLKTLAINVVGIEYYATDHFKSLLRTSNLNTLILFKPITFKKHSEFELGSFQRTSKKGTLLRRIYSPVALDIVTDVRRWIIAAWNEEEQRRAARGEDTASNPRPNIEIARYIPSSP